MLKLRHVRYVPKSSMGGSKCKFVVFANKIGITSNCIQNKNNSKCIFEIQNTFRNGIKYEIQITCHVF